MLNKSSFTKQIFLAHTFELPVKCCHSSTDLPTAKRIIRTFVTVNHYCNEKNRST